jgi:urease accessory protein
MNATTGMAMTEPSPLVRPSLQSESAQEPVQGEALSPAALHRLLAWLSPAFPVGGFSYSHGLEWAIEDGTVKSAEDLQSWLGQIFRHGAGRSDAILFANAYRAAAAGEVAALHAVAELAAALQPSKERHLEATAQGRAFLTAVAAAWPNDSLAALAAAFPPPEPIAYPVAVALAAAAHDIPVAPALAAYLHAFAANIISAGIRAIPIGQTDGQRVIAAVQPLAEAVAGTALAQSLDEIGGAALRADIASKKHETQYTRLFRS